jgi:DeoR/GlpR family transcriptional regulator of sugar metabolism
VSTNERRERIVAIVDERGYMAVKDLSEICQVSEMTVRRDLEWLDSQGRLQRTFGGAASLASRTGDHPGIEWAKPSNHVGGMLVDRVNVLVATSVNPTYDGLLIDRVRKKNIPIVAESLSVQDAVTVVAVDNFSAARELGRWAGEYASQHWEAPPGVLDLTYHLSNTQARSRGFMSGLRQIIPAVDDPLSLNAQSRYDTAYQLTRDALAVRPEINIVFAVNDVSAWGAINACRDLHLDPQKVIVLTFGLEGDTLKDALLAGEYCKAGLAMFPEIVGPTCVEAAILAYNHHPLPDQLITPFAVLTSQDLPTWYARSGAGWHLRGEVVGERLVIPLPLESAPLPGGARFPGRIGFVVPFKEHEWYQNLSTTMQVYASRYHIEFEIVDVQKSLEDEIDLSRRVIARCAAELVQPGDVILIDGGPLASYLAEALLGRESLTIITNSMPAFDILRENPENILLLTGGAFRSSSQVLVGPTAEGALRELRVDKLFLSVAGITLDFGLSHTHISEVTIKQAMIRSAREVILLADHTLFGQESFVQVAPLAVVHKLITDDALPASTRLDLTKMGVQVVLANV